MGIETIEQDPFDDFVSLPYQLYNSLFLTLPFSNLSKYGAELPLFAQKCKQRLEKGDEPNEIVQDFLSVTLGIESDEIQYEILILFLQLVERQVLLFDAVERAATGQLIGEQSERLLDILKQNLPEKRSIRIVLTAHPTQFYPEYLLGLINDITNAIHNNDAGRIRKLLLQLGRTSFHKPSPPTPFEEAEMLIDQFGSIFYDVYVNLKIELQHASPKLELGFWPGGDRDGNPFVTVETTKRVCDRLRSFVLERHLEKVEQIQRRITFKGVTEDLLKVRQTLQNDEYPHEEKLKKDLEKILRKVDHDHQGLFREEIIQAITALNLFGFYFASLDLRQSSQVIGEALSQLQEKYTEWNESDKIKWLQEITSPPSIEHDLIQVLKLVPEVQNRNGALGLHRFIVSHTENARHLLEIYYLSTWYAESKLDIVPLFESIEDMKSAPDIMQELFNHNSYYKHLQSRQMKQIVMLGFSDGTKDGGYVACNWEIQKCKQKLSELSQKSGIEIVFFDGRGGPPARGGGSTHKYYTSVAEKNPFNEIQLTVQGQSISSYFGKEEMAKYNLIELLAAFLQKQRHSPESLLEELAKKAFKYYQELRQNKKFIPLLMETTPLPLLGELNIASRPPSRPDGKPLSLENLRAISFVSAWSLMKINVPAFYGFGLALEEMIKKGKLENLQKLYNDSMYFRVLIGNSVQSIRKSYSPLIKYTENDPEFGELWTQLIEELKRTKDCLMKVTGKTALHLDNPIVDRSVSMREEIVLPLLVIQHYALKRWRQDRNNVMWKKMLLKSIPPSINASRNSA